MAGNLLNIGKTGLFAAQVGLSTAGHNIANANVAGFSRQGVQQGTAIAQHVCYGFVGSGTEIRSIRRFSDDFLNGQVRSAQSSVSSLGAFYGQISQVDNMLADTTSGLSPALQEFFKGVQDVASNPSSVASRQALLSTGDMLASRFQGIDARLSEIREGVNSGIAANVTTINSYARQIAELNDQIGTLGIDSTRQPNDLLDARDKLVADMNRQVKTTVTAGSNNSLTVSIGNGQPLVVGGKSFELAVTSSPTDISRVQVGYVTGDKVTMLSDKSFTGGELGGLLEFRSGTLDRTQNSMGRIALGIASTFNAQHRMGQDEAGQMGGDFFVEGQPFVGRSRNNNPQSTTDVKATISDVSKLTQSDYMVNFNGSNYVVKRMSDSQETVINPYPQVTPQSIDGVDFDISGAAAAGDSFIVKPTINGASTFAMALQDRSKIAAAAPISTSAPISNLGTGKISAGFVDASYLTAGNALTAPVSLSFDTATASLSGFPVAQDVKVTSNGVSTTYVAGTPDIPYLDGATYSFGGTNVVISGAPVDGDVFKVAPNVGGVGDNRNMRELGALQTKNIMDGSSATFQSSYAELVSFVGNKTREAQVNGQSSDALLSQATSAQQSVSGVNLDEEASNLLRYQQAYQAAGKVMQIASTLFDTLLSLGR